MRTNQISLRVEIFDQEEPIQFSIYTDSNNLTESLTRMMHALYKRLSVDMTVEEYDKFIEQLFVIPGTIDESGVCEVYGDVHKSREVLEQLKEEWKNVKKEF